MELAPIVVSVYTRLEHFKQCMKALSDNYLAAESEIYIVSDNAGKIEHQDDVNSIREFARTIKGFKKVNLIFRENNLGSHKSINSAIEQVINKHGKVIFLEDDIITTRDFLSFMNECLEFYKDDKRIFSITGFNIPMDGKHNYKKDVYIWPCYCPWGMATWKERWNDVDWECKGYNNFINNKENVKKTNRISQHIIPILKDDRSGRIQASDVRICYNMLLKGQSTIYPTKTKVKNIGLDGSGEHGGESKIYGKVNITEDKFILEKDIQPDRRMYRLQRIFGCCTKKTPILYLAKGILFGVW